MKKNYQFLDALVRLEIQHLSYSIKIIKNMNFIFLQDIEILKDKNI